MVSIPEKGGGIDDKLIEGKDGVIGMSARRNADGRVKSGRHLMEAGQAKGRLADKVSVPLKDVVETLVSILGRRLTAYVASVKDARAIDPWLGGVSPNAEVEARLRLACRVAVMLVGADSPEVVKAWLIGLNPELGDAVPIELLRDGDIAIDGRRVLGAAKAFAIGG